MRAFGDLFLIFLIKSKPLMSGNCRSISATSGRNSRNRSSAAPPVPAAPANVMSGCRLMIAASPSRTTGWSSTHNTRILPPSFMNLFRPVHACVLAMSSAEVPCRAWMLESTVSELRSAIFPLGASRKGASHLGKGVLPEPTNSLPYPRLCGSGWKYRRATAGHAPAFPLFHSDLDGSPSELLHSSRGHYPELESATVARHNLIARESAWRGHAEKHLRLPVAQLVRRHCRALAAADARGPRR